MLDFSRCRLPPFAHQREDVQALLDHPYFFIASEMRTGKSKIVVDAAQFLFEAGAIDKVIVVAPAPVRDVWYDPQLGEIAKHAWQDLPIHVIEFHARTRSWVNVPVCKPRSPLRWYCTNFEFLRSKNRLEQLLPACGPKTLFVLDESSFVKNHAAAQTKACAQLRKACGRVVLLNGTPLFHSPLDLFSQGNLLHPSVLDCKYVTLFKARYGVQTPVLRSGGAPMTNAWGKPIMKVEKWVNLDDLQRRFAPVTVRRLQKECLDLPPKLDPVTLTAVLSDSWPAYKQMQNEMVVWLQSDVATASTAAIKALRLSQITGGFLGGIENANIGEDDDRTADATDVDATRRTEQDDEDDLGGTSTCDRHGRTDLLTGVLRQVPSSRTSSSPDPISKGEVDRQIAALSNVGSVEIGREKLDVLLWFIEQRLEEDENLHLVAWGRFRAEVFRAHDEVIKRFPQFETGLVLGGQKRADRLRALALLKPETSPKGPVFVAGIEGTGSFGLDMCAAHTCVTMSSGYSPGRSAQTLDRLYGPGQRHPIAYYDIVAVGPKGQKTIDKDILVARREGQDLADLTTAGWVRMLKEE